MIRDAETIYGEANDPNTVIAAGTLTDGNLIVGAGNKGVKTLLSTGKVILWVRNGILQQLPFTAANKVLGTDADGNLVWLDA